MPLPLLFTLLSIIAILVAIMVALLAGVLARFGGTPWPRTLQLAGKAFGATLGISAAALAIVVSLIR
jgi:hypothetical protein